MKKTTLALGLCLALATTASAQKQVGISATVLQQIEKSQGSTAKDKALFNAIASNKIDNLAKNFSNRNTFDTHFSVETAKQSITTRRVLDAAGCSQASTCSVLTSHASMPTCFCALATTASAQKQVGISATVLQQIEKSQGSTAKDKALFNAIASNKIDNLAKNFSNRNTFDTHFSVETAKQSITTRRVLDAAGCSQASTCSVLTSHASMPTLLR